MNDRSEQRHHNRYLVEEMDIHGKMVFATEVKILNISISGIAIRADRRLNIGSEYSLRIEDGGRQLSVRGVVVWSNISGSREDAHGEHVPLYSAGLRFSDVLNDRLTELLDFIEERKVDPDHRVTGLRFNVKDPDRAVLHFPADFHVKRISLGGMLIEAVVALAIGSRYSMEILLPDELPVRFTGRVASCNTIADKGPGHYDIGIAFVNMAEKDLSRVKEFIGMLGTITNEEA